MSPFLQALLTRVSRALLRTHDADERSSSYQCPDGACCDRRDATPEAQNPQR